MLLIIWSFVIALSFAGTLEVEERFKKYELNFDVKQISLMAQDKKIVISKKSCNERIMRDFLSFMQGLPTMAPMYVGKKEGKLNYTLDNRTYYEEFNSRRAKFLVQLPEEVMRMKVEERIKCD